MSNNATFSYGKNIRNSCDTLEKISVDKIVAMIKDTSSQLASMTESLRIIKDVDKTKFAERKKLLPYFTCAAFSPSFRKTVNLAYVEHFIIDIDHIGENGMDIAKLRERISRDPRTMVCFLSPGRDGLKVIMQLSEKCYDAGVYKLFYKKFLDEYCGQMDLEQVIDGKTCDVTRACFMSTDKDVYFNPDAEKVVMDNYIDSQDTSSMLELKREIEEKKGKNEKKSKSSPQEPPRNPDPDDETYAMIRQILNPKKKVEKAPVYVPENILSISDSLQGYIQEYGITIDGIKDIQYGRQLSGSMGTKKCEVNLFYGKRGYTIVTSTKSGTDAKLNNLLYDIVDSFLTES